MTGLLLFYIPTYFIVLQCLTIVKLRSSYFFSQQIPNWYNGIKYYIHIIR